MSIKLIAIGNRMMGDDGAGLAAAEYLLDSLQELEVEVLIGETDIDYCISQIEKDDELIIVDAAFGDARTGTVWAMTLKEAVESHNMNHWQHDRDLIGELKTSGIMPEGLLICIEVQDICFRWGLSRELQSRLSTVCSEIWTLITKYKGGF
jgi:hydrogenase maturation protease